MNIELYYTEYLNGKISKEDMLMHTMVMRRRCFEIETKLLNDMREQPNADEIIAAALA